MIKAIREAAHPRAAEHVLRAASGTGNRAYCNRSRSTIEQIEGFRRQLGNGVKISP